MRACVCFEWFCTYAQYTVVSAHIKDDHFQLATIYTQDARHDGIDRHPEKIDANAPNDINTCTTESNTEWISMFHTNVVFHLIKSPWIWTLYVRLSGASIFYVLCLHNFHLYYLYYLLAAITSNGKYRFDSLIWETQRTMEMEKR